MEVHLPSAATLKDKRQVLRHLLDSARRRYRVAASELAFHDLTQRALLGFAAIGPDAAHVSQVLDSVDRFVWSHPELEVIASQRDWLEEH
jgi:uncharacterized protein YlxP (DUF503 family)